MAPFQTEHLCGSADIAVIFVHLFQDVVAFVSGPGLMQSREFAAGPTAAAVAMNQRGQVLAVEAGGGGIHDDDALDHVAQFAHVARPRVAHKRLDSIVSDFTWTAAVSG